jgi:hypothetical protein
MNGKYATQILAGVLLCLSTACSSPYSAEDLQGQWTGIYLAENGQPLPEVDPEELSFSFTENGYRYQGNLNYREAGSYTLEPPYLYTTDTLNQATTEKTVEILQLSSDSLHLRMMENGAERVLKLYKKND